MDSNYRQGDTRYRALLDVSAALGMAPDLSRALRSVSDLLSKVVKFDTIALFLRDDRTGAASLYGLAPVADQSLEIGTGFPVLESGPILSVLESQEPAFVPDVQEVIANFPSVFAQRFSQERYKVAYLFPVTLAGRRLGVLIYASVQREQYASEDVELMSCVAAHVSGVLGATLALESASSYRRDLERERDRLKLLLEINNDTVTHLEIKALLDAASTKIREFFDVAFSGFWVLDERSGQFQCMSLDFPGSRTNLPSTVAPKLTEVALADIRARALKVMGPAEIRELPLELSEFSAAESIVSMAFLPMMGTTAPMGFFFLGSRNEHAFSKEDLDLLAQVANQICLALENALAYGRVTFSRDRLQSEKLYLQSEIESQYSFEDIVGRSKALRDVLDQVAIVAPTDATVLLIGETGTGKELVARAIHNLSPRKQRTFVRLNCAAVPSGLIESELFGHEKGAFTGALMQKHGRIELADEGSLFLDEIGDIDIELQPKLLRVLQEREFERLGSNRTIKVNVRLIAATHRDLPAMVRDEDFREDLYYRINVFPIHIPPLRERREDIPLLVHYFVASLSRKMRKAIHVIPNKVMDAMTSWPWPGNVRELQNFVERSVILSRNEVLDAPISELRMSAAPKITSAATFQGMEREAILNALRTAQGRVGGPGGAAEQLGLKRTTLQRKMQRLNISKADYF